MEIEIVSKNENQLLERLELKFRALHPNEGTPNREDVREKIATMVKVPKERVVVDSMTSEFGRNETVGYAKAYKTKEAVMKYEREHVLVRNKLKEKVKADKRPGAAKPAAEPPPEAAAQPKQEKK
jgi:small subunit ribosomal protein S24e